MVVQAVAQDLHYLVSVALVLDHYHLLAEVEAVDLGLDLGPAVEEADHPHPVVVAAVEAHQDHPHPVVAVVVADHHPSVVEAVEDHLPLVAHLRHLLHLDMVTPRPSA